MTHVKTFDYKVQIFDHSKVHNYILIKAFVMKFSNLRVFFFIYQIISPYEIYFQYTKMFMCMGSANGQDNTYVFI